MKKLIKLIIARRHALLFILFLITLLAGFQASQGVIASSIGNLFFGEDHREYKKYQKLIREFYSDEFFLVAFEDDHLLSPASIERLDRAVREIEKIPDVGKVQSVLSAVKAKFEGGKLKPLTYREWLSKNPQDRKKALAELTAKGSPYREVLVSKDGRHGAVIIELKPDKNRAMERGPQVVNEVMEIFVKAGFNREKLHRYGMIATVAEVMKQTYFNLSRLAPLVCFCLVLVLYLIFQRIWPIFITLGVALLASIWTLGFAVFLDKNINVFISASPMVITIIATADVIHICNAYLLQLAAGREKEEAIIESCAEVGKACLMTSITTFVGFVSLTFIPVPAFQQGGIVLGFGVAMALVLAVALTPILFHYMPAPRAWTQETSRGHKFLGWTLEKCENLALGRPVLVIAVFVGLIGTSLYGISQLNVETDLTARLAYDNPLRQDSRYIKKHFANPNLVTMVVTGEDLTEPQLFQKALAYEKRLSGLSEVDHVMSVAGLLKKMDQVANPFSGHPPSQEQLEQYFTWLENIMGKDLYRFVDKEKKTFLYQVRLDKEGMRTTHKYGQKFKEIADETFEGKAETEATGIGVLLGLFLNDVFIGQRQGVIFAILTIAILMIIWLKSLSVGLWSMIPNLLPLMSVMALAALVWDQVDSDTLIILIIALGIGVDDTIHFMVKLKSDNEKIDDSRRALEETFHFTGRAILITSLILMAGFLPFALSDYYSINIFGTLLPFAIFMAMIADILLVPAMARVGLIRFKKKVDDKNTTAEDSEE